MGSNRARPNSKGSGWYALYFDVQYENENGASYSFVPGKASRSDSCCHFEHT